MAEDNTELVRRAIEQARKAFNQAQYEQDRQLGPPSVRMRKKLKRDRRDVIYRVIQNAWKEGKITEDQAKGLWEQNPRPRYFPEMKLDA